MATASRSPLGREPRAPVSGGYGWYALPCLLCLALHWNGLTAWFRADDFAWLGAGIYVNNFHDLLSALFAPQAQGTIRPLSERAFFMAGFGLFGLDALPFKMVVFATEFAALVLAASIGARLTGSRAAGVCAACFWVMNGSTVLPLGWTCVYNQVLCGFLLLLAFHFLLRFDETGRLRYEIGQWIAFLLGLGALELAVVYPAIAAAWALLTARRHFRRTLPLFAVSLAYTALHNAVAPVGRAGDYGMHFTGSMLRTLGIYWTWSVGPTFLYTPFVLPAWLLPAGVVAVTLGLAAFAAARLREGARLPLFCLAWYAIAIAPVLPLRDHMTEYYVFLPVIGLAWLGGWAAAEAWRSGSARRIAAALLVAIYAGMALPEVFASGAWNREITLRVRALVEGVAGAHERYPGKSILLTGVDSTLFWNGVLDRPFRLFGLDDLYLAPGSDGRIDAHPDLGDVSRYILPGGVVEDALKRDKLVVYDASGARLRNITGEYAALPRSTSLPRRIDAASPLTSYLLGPEWYPSDGDHRWMPKRATLRIAGPAAAGASLYLRGQCPEELLRVGPLTVTVWIDGEALPPQSIQPGRGDFALSYPLPGSATGKAQLSLTVEAARSFRPASDPRDLALVFGWFEVR